jgi:hypothetical protein
MSIYESQERSLLDGSEPEAPHEALQESLSDGRREPPGVRVLTRIAGRDRAPEIEATELVSAFLFATESLPEEDVAALANVSAATIRRWRRGGVSQLRRKTRSRICSVLNGGHLAAYGPVREQQPASD